MSMAKQPDRTLSLIEFDGCDSSVVASQTMNLEGSDAFSLEGQRIAFTVSEINGLL